MPVDQPEQPCEPSARSLPAIIHELDVRSRTGKDVTLGEALDRAGARMHGAAILLLALPECIPLPIPSLGAFLGVPLLIASAHLAIFGDRGDLPERARRIQLPQRMISVMVRYLAGPLARAERISRDRVPALARRERLIGALCILMSVLLLMPVPFMNAAPAITLVCLSWGLLQRDGVFVGLGIAMAVGVMVAIILLIDLISTALTGVAA
ncbi:exopolysaccharide biosynthesis protein [Puniceibacterium sediminis]|uniref:Uncharacterized conserved protein n=1 Tax=Puniceibacterium sediminis TaxID=1608407 RepID=A0A238ZNX0_9RHOB|nr:exopolysaccharide biosynthesis protein [Puniceibacterium sediminis]SNR84852.1 Uncharacterized conserved protein [Puniceibacterium sediminis]